MSDTIDDEKEYMGSKYIDAFAVELVWSKYTDLHDEGALSTCFEKARVR